MFRLVIFATLLLLGGVQARSCASPTVVGSEFDLKAYMGRWYEIATGEQFRKTFESGLECTTADYTLNSNQTVTVVNSGRFQSPDGTLKQARGVGRQTSQGGGHLEVSFFGPFYGPYLITQLYGSSKQGYSVVAIYSCTSGLYFQEDFWILSRTPTLPASIRASDLYQRAEKMGIPIPSLNVTDTSQPKTCVYV